MQCIYVSPSVAVGRASGTLRYMGFVALKVHSGIAESVTGLFCKGTVLLEHFSAVAANEVT